MLRPLRTPHTGAILFAVLIAIVTALAYQPAWHGGFIWDDDAYITSNPLLTAPDGLRRIWFSLDSPSQYFPLVYTTFRFEHALWGLNPTGYHLVNLALHIINALLVWRVLRALAIPGAMLAAAIFALHPVQVESVAWITERKNVLMGFFFLLVLLCWIRFVDNTSPRRWRIYALALVLYALALFSKTTACTLPAALLLIVWWKNKTINLRRVWEIVPFAVIGLAMGLVTVWWERFHQGTRGEFFALNPLERLLVASRAVWFYLGKLLWPAKLTFIYPRWEIHATDPLAYVWVFAAFAAAAALFAFRRQVGRGPAAAAIFFVATLSPILGFIMLYTFRYTFVADHYQYLASIGPIALAAGGFSWLAERRRHVAFVASVAVVLLLAVLTRQQAAMYSNIEALWRTTLERNPGSWMAHNNLGIELAQQGRTAEAIPEYQKTVELRPNYPEAHYNLANELLKQGDVAGALAQSEIAITLQPKDADAHVTRGNALAAARRVTEAREEYNAALALRPQHPDAHYNLALMLVQEGDAEQALPEIKEALALRDDPKFRTTLANALLALHRNSEAITQFETALSAGPNDVVALCNLAWALATSGDAKLRDGARAVELAETANRLTNPPDPVVLRSLAAAYAETAQYANAVATAETALQRAHEAGQRELEQTIETELAVYRSGAPYHE